MVQEVENDARHGANEEGMHLRRRFLIIQNGIGVILSIPVLGTGIWLRSKNREDCAAFLHRPIIILGILLLIVSLLGLLAAIFKKTLVWIHLLVLFCLVTLLFCLAIFALEITNQDLGRKITQQGQTYIEYRLNQYPKWMRHRVEDPKYWAQVKSCLQRSPHICGNGIFPANNGSIFYAELNDLSPVQIGCCKAPSECNSTYLGVPSQTSYQESTMKRSIHPYVHDCKHWSELPSQLCYDCDTCKAGEIQASMNHWRVAGYVFVLLVMIMSITYALFACFGFKEIRRRRIKKDQSPGQTLK